MLSKPKEQKKKEMTQEEHQREEEREELIAEKKARHKKFDFAEFVNRDREPDKKQSAEEAKSKSTTARKTAKESQRTSVYAGTLGKLSSKLDEQATASEHAEKLVTTPYKPPTKSGRAPRQEKQGPLSSMKDELNQIV